MHLTWKIRIDALWKQKRYAFASKNFAKQTYLFYVEPRCFWAHKIEIEVKFVNRKCFIGRTNKRFYVLEILHHNYKQIFSSSAKLFFIPFLHSHANKDYKKLKVKKNHFDLKDLIRKYILCFTLLNIVFHLCHNAVCTIQYYYSL